LKFKFWAGNTLNYCLRVLLLPLVICSMGMAFHSLPLIWTASSTGFILLNGVLIILTLLLARGIYLLYKRGYSAEFLLCILIGIALICRLIWVFSVNTQPVSDFLIMYNTGAEAFKGNFTGFHGTAYFARFPHITIPALYFGFFQWLFKSPLIAIKLTSVVWSTISVYLIYSIVKEVFGKGMALSAALIAALYPAFIMYTSVISTESAALCLFLWSVYIFIKVIKKKLRAEWFLLCGLLLSMGNFLRMVGPVMVIAYIMYLLIFRSSLHSLKGSIYIAVSFLVPLVLISTLLIKTDLTENPLWKGVEPASTSILKGTNLQTMGGWNPEDAAIYEKYDRDYEAVDKAAKAIIKDRLTNTPPFKLVRFYIAKYSTQWSVGDYAGYSWAIADFKPNEIPKWTEWYKFYTQLLHAVIIVLVYLGLYLPKNRRQEESFSAVNLFYIVFYGYMLLYLITEMQPRYAFSSSWVFILLLPAGIERIRLWLDF